MAGSMKYVSYTDDLDKKWALKHDESNWEAINGDTADITPANIAAHLYEVPGNIIPRFATFRSTTTTKVRRIVLATRSVYTTYIQGGGDREFTEDGETFALVGVTPEFMRPLVFAADTGLNDGDET